MKGVRLRFAYAILNNMGAKQQTLVDQGKPLPTTLEGVVKKCLVYKAESGWCSIRVTTNAKDLPVVGFAVHEPREGYRITATGLWDHDPRFGDQFKATTIVQGLPLDRATAASVLASLDATLTEPEAYGLLDLGEDRFTVEGVAGLLPPDRAERFVHAWEGYTAQPRTMKFLNEEGVRADVALWFVRSHPDFEQARLTRNPYALIVAPPISFETCEKMAQKFGVPPTTVGRIQAAGTSVLREQANDGHTRIPINLFLQSTAKKTGLPLSTIRECALDTPTATFTEKHAALLELDAAERTIADRIIEARKAAEHRLKEPGYEEIRKLFPFEPDKSQFEAILQPYRHRVCVLSGGPGYGKTTITEGAVKTWDGDVILVAPTGAAAKRLHAATRMPTATIHSLLKGKPNAIGEWDFMFNAERQLNGEKMLVVVDEASMLDAEIAAALMSAFPSDTRFMFVGDVHQLPSVGAGNVLEDLITAGVPTTYLEKTHRTGADSQIPILAEAMKRGQVPVFPQTREARFIPALVDDEAREVYRAIAGMRKAGVDLDDLRVISPMNRGVFGVHALNHNLQAFWNEANMGKAGYAKGRVSYDVLSGDPIEEVLYPGDVAVFTQNNISLGLNNGDRVRILEIEPNRKKKPPRMFVECDGAQIEVEGHKDMSAFALAYATSHHKVQGDQAKYIVQALVMGHRKMLNRRLVYTGWTRPRESLTVVGHQRAIEGAARDVGGAITRLTALPELLGASQQIKHEGAGQALAS